MQIFTPLTRVVLPSMLVGFSGLYVNMRGPVTLGVPTQVGYVQATILLIAVDEHIEVLRVQFVEGDQTLAAQGLAAQIFRTCRRKNLRLRLGVVRLESSRFHPLSASDLCEERANTNR
jgi:hypothetical protein